MTSKLKEVSSYEPLNSWVLVKSNNQQSKETEEGWTHSTDVKNRGIFENSTGIIMKLGNSLHKEYSHLKVGDEVRYFAHRGEAVANDDDFLYRAIQDIDIYLITKKGNQEELSIISSKEDAEHKYSLIKDKIGYTIEFDCLKVAYKSILNKDNTCYYIFVDGVRFDIANIKDKTAFFGIDNIKLTKGN